MECVLGHLPYEVSMVTPSESFFNGMLSEGVVSAGIIPGVFSLVMHWCVHGSKRRCVGNVGVDDFWVVCFSVAGTWSAVSPNIFADFSNSYPWCPWNVWFSFLIFCISRVSVVAILCVVSIVISIGISKFLG